MIQMVENRSSPSEASPPPGADDLRRRLSRLFTAVEQSRLLANDKMVLKSMIGAASRTGFELNCQQKDIARRACVSEATVSRALRRLLDQELLVERSHFGRKRWLLKQERILALPDEPIRLPRPRPRPSTDDEATQAPGAARGRVTPISLKPASRQNRTEIGGNGHQALHSSPRQTDGEKTEPCTPPNVNESIVISIPTGSISNGVIALLTQLLEKLTRREAPAPAPQPPFSQEDAGPSGHHASAIRPPKPEKATRNASAGGAISRKTSVADDVWSGSFVKSAWVHSGPPKTGLTSWQDKGSKWSMQLQNATCAAVKPVQLQREMHHSIQDATPASPPSSESFLNNSSTLDIPASSSSSSSTPHPETGPSAPETVKVQGSLRSPEPSQGSGIEVLKEPRTPPADAPLVHISPPGGSVMALGDFEPELHESLEELHRTDDYAAAVGRYYVTIIREIACASGRRRNWQPPTNLQLQGFLHLLPAWLKQDRDLAEALISWHEYLLIELATPGRPFLPPLQSFKRHLEHLDENQRRASLREIQLAHQPADSELLPANTLEQAKTCQEQKLRNALTTSSFTPALPAFSLPTAAAEDYSFAEYLRLMGLVEADWTPLTEEQWIRPSVAPTPSDLVTALRGTLWHLEEQTLPDWQRKERQKAQLNHHERERWIGSPSMRMLLPHLPQYLQLPALRLYHLSWTGGFAYLHGPEWQLMNVLASALFQSRWEDDAQYGPAVRDDAELANLLFPKEERSKGEMILRYHDCFLELGVAPPKATALILHELLHRRKHAASGGITLLTCRYSPTELCQRLATVSPGTDHSLRELLPSLISDRCFFVGRKNPGKEKEAAG